MSATPHVLDNYFLARAEKVSRPYTPDSWNGVLMIALALILTVRYF